MEQHLTQQGERARSDHAVGLLVVASDDVADGAQGGGLHDFFAGGNELHEVLDGNLNKCYKKLLKEGWCSVRGGGARRCGVRRRR